jgi:sugar O-acyltransferase (sialic acid O-acetyltransferase NeuD family)
MFGSSRGADGGAVSLYGTGGHADVVADVLHACDREIYDVFDDRRAAHFFGGHVVQPGIRSGGAATHIQVDQPIIICIGDNRTRADIAGMLSATFGIAIHPTVLIGTDVSIGQGTVVFHRAAVQTGTRVGRHVIINTAATVEENCVIDDFSHVSPRAHIGANVRVEEGAHIGAAAIITPGVRLGEWCVIGAGTIVTDDVPAYATMVGHPPRILSEPRQPADASRYSDDTAAHHS